MISMRSLCNIFEKHSVTVTGMKGCGKDMLFSNVIARRNKPYVSNLDYTNGDNFYNLDYSLLLPHANYDDLIRGFFKPYSYPYPIGSDIYISDAGIYFPSQYFNELNKKYPSFPMFMALSRHLGEGTKVHVNVQNLNRVWDKIREMSDMYITCNWCKVLFGKLVIQKITIYDKYESCLNRVRPCRVRAKLLNDSNANATIDTYLDNFYNSHGEVHSHILIYFNKSDYDTIYFKKVFENGGCYEK